MSVNNNIACMNISFSFLLSPSSGHAVVCLCERFLSFCAIEPILTMTVDIHINMSLLFFFYVFIGCSKLKKKIAGDPINLNC